MAQANRIVGEYNLGVGKVNEAIERYNQGIAAVRSTDRPELVAHLSYLRAVAYRRQGKYELAHQDIQEAIRLAKGTGEGQLVSHYEAELATIEGHAGRSLGSPP